MFSSPIGEKRLKILVRVLTNYSLVCVFVPYRGKEIKNTVPRKPPNSTASEALCGWNRFLGFFICFPILFCRRNPLFIRCVAKLQKSVFFSLISKLNIHFKTKNVKFLFYFAFYYLIHIIVWIPVFVFCFYFCSYYQFFKHVAPYMDFMKNELMNQRPPANIMEALKNGDLKIEY